MLGVTVISARWVLRHFGLAGHPAQRVGVGLLGLGFLVIAEAAGVLWIRRMSVSEYVASRDPISGPVYVLMLGVFAGMPLLVARHNVNAA